MEQTFFPLALIKGLIMSQGLCPSCGAAVNLTAANNADETSPIVGVQAVVVGNSIKYKESEVIEAIKAQFTDENAKKFLDSYWQKKRRETGIKETGFCYWASHAYFHFMGGKSAGLRTMKWLNPAGKNKGHFWVEKANVEAPVDLTSKQYGDKFEHYKDGGPASPRKSGKIQEFISLVEAELAS